MYLKQGRNISHFNNTLIMLTLVSVSACIPSKYEAYPFKQNNKYFQSDSFSITVLYWGKILVPICKCCFTDATFTI